MSGETPYLQACTALRSPCNEQILTNMENFSTPQRAILPWVANLATLAVVVAAIGWSGEQRPDVSAAAASAAASATKQSAPLAGLAATPQTDAQQGRWPAKTTLRPINGLQAVGYSPGQTP